MTVTACDDCSAAGTKQRPDHRHPFAHRHRTHAGKSGKARPAGKAHHHSFCLVTGMLADQKTGPVAARLGKQMFIAARPRPFLKAGRWCWALDPDVVCSNAAGLKPGHHTRRLSVGPRANAMVDDDAAMRATMCRGEPLRMEGKGHAVRPAGNSADQPVGILKARRWRQLRKCRCQRPVKDRREGVGK